MSVENRVGKRVKSAPVCSVAMTICISRAILIWSLRATSNLDYIDVNLRLILISRPKKGSGHDINKGDWYYIVPLDLFFWY